MGRRDGRDGYGLLIRWEDTVSNLILGTEPNAPLDYAQGLELHCLTMSMIRGHRGRLDIYIYIYSNISGARGDHTKFNLIIDANYIEVS